ncbi:hypothetical protein MN116_004506 [Schistosoma mekongi]|uniref:START domain-containing protein n=1 Tax=Schistosoma mekongi TaxID=38744 RepID=A0AAE1ZFK6_SCHME|nr:hypothetical protein MN116_004506 [Schistosoma mekongi]
MPFSFVTLLLHLILKSNNSIGQYVHAPLPTSSTLPLSNANVQSSIYQLDSTQTPKIDHQSIITDKDLNNTTRSGGFFSRFLPFRNFSNWQNVQTVVESDNVDVKDNKTNDTVTTTSNIEKETSQYRPSSRFNDLRRILQQHGGHALDFKGEAHMFKAITAGILTNLSHSVEMMQQHEEQWRKRLEREIERRRRLEETQKAMTQELLHLRSLIGLSTTTYMITSNHLTHNHPSHSRFASYGSSLDFKHFLSDNFKESISKCNGNIIGCDGVPGVNSTSTTVNENIRRLVGPDYEEGLTSPIREEEFFDAIDAESDKMEQNEVRLAALKSASEAIRWARAMPSDHPLYSELDKVVKMHIKNFASTKIFDYASKLCSTTSSLFSSSSLAATLSTASTDIDSQENNSNSSSSSTDNSQSEIPENWRVVVQEGDMVIFRRELVSDDGVVLDPLQAVHVVHGVTAREMCTYFWDVRYRMDWEFTVDRAPDVLEVCGDDTVVIYQMYKRVWPTTQRDSLFWSHICPVNPIQKNSSRKLNYRSSMSSGRHNIQQSKLHQRSASMGTTLTSNGLSSQSTTTVNCNPEVVQSNQASNIINNSSDNILDGWMVVNMSTNYLSDKIPSSTSPTIRLGLEVVLFCRTEILSNSLEIHSSSNDLTKLSRDQLCTRLIYMANINPGGWVPATGLRSLAQREYPRFLKRFSTYVKEQTQHKLPLF